MRVKHLSSHVSQSWRLGTIKTFSSLLSSALVQTPEDVKQSVLSNCTFKCIISCFFLVREVGFSSQIKLLMQAFSTCWSTIHFSFSGFHIRYAISSGNTKIWITFCLFYLKCLFMSLELAAMFSNAHLVLLLKRCRTVLSFCDDNHKPPRFFCSYGRQK